MNQYRCNHCEAKQNRETLEQILTNSIHLQGERQINPPCFTWRQREQADG